MLLAFIHNLIIQTQNRISQIKSKSFEAKLVPIDLIVFIAALIVAWLVFTALIRVVKTTLSTALTVAAIVLILQLGLGVQPQQLWQQIVQLPQIIRNLLTGT